MKRILSLIGLFALVCTAYAQHQTLEERIYALGTDFWLGPGALLTVKFVPTRMDTVNYENTDYVHVYGYMMSTTEVSQGLWCKVMGENPSTVADTALPVYNVSPEQAETFVHRLDSILLVGLRLPTFEEWTFAFGGGELSEHYLFSGSNNVGTVAWYKGNSKRKPHPGGQRVPNELGLYDMSGNVSELVKLGEETYTVLGGDYRSESGDCSLAVRNTLPQLAPLPRTDSPVANCGVRILFPYDTHLSLDD